MTIEPELVARMEALVRGLAVGPNYAGISGYRTEARAIVALLPKQIDPDVVEVRHLAEDFGWYSCNALPMLRDGSYDDRQLNRDLLKAIKRGRELAARDAS